MKVKVVMDGIMCYFSKSLEDTYYRICHEWEKIVGNEELGKLEYTDFLYLAQESVNHYFAVKKGGGYKVKGRFVVDDSLHKNNTDKISRIERLALQEYFLKRIPVEETIKKETNIYMFCTGMKGSKNYYFKSVDSQYKETSHYKRVMRFYVSTDGVTLTKNKYENSDATGAEVTKIVNGHKITICNDISLASIDNIDYQYYIDGCHGIINRIEGKKDNKNQLSLF